MLKTMLRQQDHHYFAADARLKQILNWISGHADALAGFGAEARQTRQLPPSCVELLREGGLFDLALDVDADGVGLTSAGQARALEELAKIDASISWCVMIGMDSGIYRGFVSDKVRKDYFPRPGLATAGWVHPQGRADDLGDGTCRISGRWQFASGIDHADVVMAGVVYKKTEQDPGSWRIAVLDKTQVTIEDTWHTWGLQGSGSQHYHAENLIIPTDRTLSLFEPTLPGPMHHPHDGILRKMAGIPLGVAIGALQTAVDATTKKAAGLRDSGGQANDRVLNNVGRISGDVLALRAAVYDSLTQAWTAYTETPENTEEVQAALVAAAAVRQRAFRHCRELVLDAADLLGARGVYTASSDLGARVTDMQVMTQHAVGQEALLDLVGNRIVGGEATDAFL